MRPIKNYRNRRPCRPSSADTEQAGSGPLRGTCNRHPKGAPAGVRMQSGAHGDIGEPVGGANGTRDREAASGGPNRRAYNTAPTAIQALRVELHLALTTTACLARTMTRRVHDPRRGASLPAATREGRERKKGAP